MTEPDCFAILALPRAAALEEPNLHRAYTTRSRTAHPDHGGNEADSASLNAAYETLRYPHRRLKHLLEIAGPAAARAWRTVPLDDAMMALFSDLSAALEASARFLERKAKATSALAKALLTNEELQHRETLEHIGFQLEQRKCTMEAQLPALDAALAMDSALAWQELAAIQAQFAYLAKWQTQVRERLLALM